MPALKRRSRLLLLQFTPRLPARSSSAQIRFLRRGAAVYSQSLFARAGGLASYGSSLPAAYRLKGNYTGKILKGTKPADLPVQQATKIELYISLKTAKALSLTVKL